jgi:hypothetical protein
MLFLLVIFISGVYSCSTSSDCQLNGDCVNKVCVCDAAWTGPTCSVLNLLPAPPNGGLKRSDISSWGGSVIKIGNEYHMYAAEMANHCGLNTWTSNSIIVHATSNTPEGPYTKVGEVMTYFSHNPTVVMAPDNSLLIYHIGTGGGGNPKTCTNGSTPTFSSLPSPPLPDVAGFDILYSTSPNGPWTEYSDSGSTCDGSSTVDGFYCGCTDNPAPVVNANGEVLVLSRSWNSNVPLTTLIGVAKANSWKGPYVHSHNPIFLDQNEDPYLYRNKRGYHALFHGMKPYAQDTYAGRHAFSVDGWNWTFSDLPAYNSTVHFTNGQVITFSRRERPHLLLNDQGEPTHLFTGVQQYNYNDYTWTHVQPINT